MNVSRSEFDGTPAPADVTTRRQSDGDVDAAMHAAPDENVEDQQSEEPTEEPGYGHGV
jgi:hypothetical protein